LPWKTGRVLSQDIVFTPRADFDNLIVKENGDSITDIFINIRKTLFQ
jgi:hypothetical protein